MITYQGRLLSPSRGVAKSDGTYPIVFRVYNHPFNAGANLLWTEPQDAVVQNGLFNVLLGSVTPFPAEIFNGQNLWLGVKAGSDPELAPRTRISAVAYALYADNADRLDGLDTAAFATTANIMPTVLDADSLDGEDSTAFPRGKQHFVNQFSSLSWRL